MAIYAIILTDTHPKVQELISKNYDDSITLNDRVTIVKTKEISGMICRKIRLIGDDKFPDAEGAVIQLHGTYSGYTSTDFWAWMDNHQDDF